MFKHLSKIPLNFTKFHKLFQEFHKNLRKIHFFIIYGPIRRNELALTLCEPIHNLSDPEKLSTRIIWQLVFSEDTLFTEQYFLPWDN